MEKHSSEDRRKETRHDVCIEAGIMTSNSTFKALVTNLSGGGLEIQADHTITPQKKILISIRLQEEFVFHGTILWTLCDFVGQKWVYRIGVDIEAIGFKNMTATTLEERSELVKMILPRVQAKGAIHQRRAQKVA